MAYISFQPKDFFKTVLYTGNATARDIGGVGFQPDMTLIKGRTSTENWHLFDSARGATKRIYPNNNAVESAISTTLDEFQADGFGIGGADDGVNQNTIPFIAYNWKMGTSSGITTNGSTTQTPTAYSFNQTTGMSAIAYTGGGSAGQTFAHGLGVAPEVILIKSRSATEWWNCYFEAIGNTKYLMLNNNEATSTNSNRWNNTTPDAVNVTLGAAGEVNGQNGNYIAYCFTSIAGFSSFGKYVGNGQTTGPRIYTGFKPSYVVCKRNDGTGYWIVVDSARGTDKKMYLNDTNADATEETITFLSDGFKIRNTGGDYNTNGGNYIYMAFAKDPTVSNNGKAATAE